MGRDPQTGNEVPRIKDTMQEFKWTNHCKNDHPIL